MTEKSIYKNKNVKEKIFIEPLFNNNIVETLRLLSFKKSSWWIIIFILVFVYYYPNGLFTILFCYMWWHYLIPDILDVVCHYLSIQRKQRINCKITLLKSGSRKKEGLISYICNGSWNKGYTNKSINVLEKYGNLPIKSLYIYRTPMSNAIDTSLNIVTFGKWNKLKKQLGIDTFFHLSLIAKVCCGNGRFKNIVIEKNEMINISSCYDKNAYIGSEKMKIDNVSVGTDKTINNILENTRKKLKNLKYFSYDAFENNCQMYIKNILHHNSLYNDTIHTFLYQDTSQLLSNLPYYAKKIINFSTNTFVIICGIIQKI